MTSAFFRFCLLVLLLPLPAQAALPRSANVPGGIAIVQLGPATAAAPPQAWFKQQPVLVFPDADHWYALVGLSLDTKPGSHVLRIREGEKSETRNFKVGRKHYPVQRITLKDKGKVELSAADAERALREIAEIRQLKLHWRPAPDTDPAFVLPAAGELGGRFGVRRFFNGAPRAPHAGLDVAVPGGTPVVASSHGTVLAVADYFFNGKTVFLDHGNGLITLYCHLDRIDVSKGDTVGKGQPLGLSGQTGRATGPHLHWSVVLNGAMVDPELFIAQANSTPPAAR